MEQSIKLFVILGTQKFPFHRLVEAVEKIIVNGMFSKEEVLIQSGFTAYKNESVNIIQSVPVEEYTALLKNAQLIITHAGVNSILSCMKLQKDFIIVPRLEQYGEHVNNHQVEIAEVMKSQFDVLVMENTDNLPEFINKARKHVYKQWNPNNKKLLESISDYLAE